MIGIVKKLKMSQIATIKRAAFYRFELSFLSHKMSFNLDDYKKRFRDIESEIDS